MNGYIYITRASPLRVDFNFKQISMGFWGSLSNYEKFSNQISNFFLTCNLSKLTKVSFKFSMIFQASF